MRARYVSVVFAVLLVGWLLTAPAAVAAQPSEGEVDQMVDLYNENVEEAPDALRDRLADERVLITVEQDGEEAIQYTAVTDDEAQIEELSEGSDDPTVKVTTDEETIDEVANADDPANESVEAYENEDVEVEGVGVTNRVSIGAMKVGHRIGSALGLI